MIELGEITAGIAELIRAATGVFATDARLDAAVYPSVFVDAAEPQTSVIAGGRQVFRRVSVTITCHASREREHEQTRELTFAVYAALLPYFSICGRKLAPINMATGGESGHEVSFTLEFCDVAPANLPRNAELMDSLNIRLSGQE